MKRSPQLLLSGLLLAAVACAQPVGITSAINSNPPSARNGGNASGNIDWFNREPSTTETAADGREVNTTAFPTYPPMPVACDSAPYAVRGSFKSGVTTLYVNGRAVEIWYPAAAGFVADMPPDTYDVRDFLPVASAQKIPDHVAPLHFTDAYRDIPISKLGPFPVLLFSHGFAGFRLQSSFLMTHLASWGFIVASTEHPERGLAALMEGGIPDDNAVVQLQETITRLRTENGAPDGFFYGGMDFEKMGALGHSAGGAAVGALAGANTIRAWATLASAGFKAAPKKDGLVMGGTSDQFATTTLVRDSFDKYDAGDEKEKRLVSIAKAGHLAFTDLCVIGKEMGGLLSIAQEYDLEVPSMIVNLANDGCLASDLPAQEAWTIVNHYVTAHFKASLGISQSDTALSAISTSCFGSRIADSSFREPPLQEEKNRRPIDDSQWGPNSQNGNTNAPGNNPEDLIAVAQSTKQFEHFLAALQTAGLTETLKGPGIYTVFAPTDKAFELMNEEALQALLDDKEELRNMLFYHISAGLIHSGVLANLPELLMLNDEDVEIEVMDDLTFINDSALIQPDILASNGVIHVIDSLLFPSNLLSFEMDNSGANSNDSTNENNEPDGYIVNCGGQSCDIETLSCCVGLGGQSCKSQCGLFEAAQKCDGPEDCEGEDLCCADYPAGSSCNSGCSEGQDRLCHVDDDCPETMACELCSFPGSPPTKVCKANGC